MATSKDDIREWFLRGVFESKTHMIVVCDTFDYEDYPVYVSPGDDIRDIEKKYKGADMQKVMEVYKLTSDVKEMERQLSLGRCFVY